MSERYVIDKKVFINSIDDIIDKVKNIKNITNTEVDKTFKQLNYITDNIVILVNSIKKENY